MLYRLEQYVEEAAFDADSVRVLTAAFDEAWQSIQSSGISLPSAAYANAIREILALRIIEMARLGERDRRRLCDDALLHLAQLNAKSSGL
jgi:hypothetical protein